MKLQIGGNKDITEFVDLYETKEEYQYVASIYDGAIHFWFKEKYDNLTKAYKKIKHIVFKNNQIEKTEEFIYPTLPPEEELKRDANLERLFISTYLKDFDENEAREIPELQDLCFRDNYKLSYRNFLTKKTEEKDGIKEVTYEVVVFDVNQKLPVGTTNPNAQKFADVIKTTAKTEEIEVEYKIRKIKHQLKEIGNEYECKILEEKIEKMKFAGLGLTIVEAKSCNITDVIIQIEGNED